MTLVAILIAQIPCQADEPETKPQIISSQIDVEQRGLLHEDYSAKVDLGALPVDNVFQYLLNLQNTTTKPFNLSDIGQSCNCVSIEVEKRLYNAGETIPIRLSVSTSNKTTGAQAVQTVHLFEKTATSSRAIPIAITFKIAGILSFTQDMYIVAISEKPSEHEISIPFQISAPIQFHNLTFKSDANAVIHSPRFASGKTPETGQLTFLVSSQKLNGTSESITIQIQDQKNAKSDSTILVIQRTSLFDVAPSVLRFRKTDNEGTYQASCIIVRRGNTKSEPESQKNITVEASFGGRAINTTITRATAHMARVILSADKSVLDHTDSQVVNWSLSGPEGKASVSTSFIIEKE